MSREGTGVLKVTLTDNHPLTEKEWLECPLPGVMGNMLGYRDNVRRLRLFACACCRRAWHLLDHEASRRAVEVAERHADGRATDEELEAARLAAWDVSLRLLQSAAPSAARLRRAADSAKHAATPSGDEYVSVDLCGAATQLTPVLGPDRERESPPVGAFKPDWRPWAGLRVGYANHGETREAAIQAGLLRDIFGNPFRPVAFSTSWRTDTAVTLARQMYDARDFSAMPILADALQDAGCDNTDVLDHCRGPGPHVRGCWVVDLVLGKE